MNYKNYNDYELIYMVQENDEDSYNTLFQKYIPIIRNIAITYYKKYSSYGYELDDFVQEGYVAFQKAVKKYNPSRDALFYTFVVLCIHRNLISFCQTITCEKKNISNTHFIPFEDDYLSDGIDSVSDYFMELDLYHSIWDIVYQNSLETISIFELRWNHFKFREISILLDIPVRRCQTIYKHLLFKIQNKLSHNM